MQTVAHLAVSYLVVLVMLGVGLRARAPDIIGELRRPRRILIGVAAIDIAVPLLALLVIQLVQVPTPIGKLFLLFAICPAAPFALPSLQERGAAGTVGLALVAVLLTASIVTVPSWVWILDRAHAVPILSYAGDVGVMLGGKLFLPLVVGMTVRSLSDRVADAVGRVVGLVLAVAMVFAVILLFKVGAPSLAKINVPIAIAALLILAGDALIIGRLVPRNDPALRDALGSIAARGNPALALAVISHNDPSLKWGGFVAAYVIFRALALVPLKMLSRQGSRAKRALPDRPS